MHTAPAKATVDAYLSELLFRIPYGNTAPDAQEVADISCSVVYVAKVRPFGGPVMIVHVKNLLSS